MRLPVRLVYNLAEGSPRRRGRPVSLPPSYHLITGFYHLEPFLRFGKHVRETASFQQKRATPYGVAIDNRGAKGIRTPDPLHAMEMRYQLRHSPKVCPANSV